MQDLTRDRIVAAVGALYEIEEELGRGGMAVVFRARDLRLRRHVAIKVLPPELAFRADVRARFLREAETAAQLSHPHIVPIYSVDERDGLVFFVMGLVEGETLGEMLARAPRPPVAVVRRVLSEVADALHYAHGRGVVHRDVKPDNILIERESGRAVVTDFGIARAAEGESRLTLTGVTVGTPAYMSPEQALGESELDGRSDLYSLAIVGYEMLAGELPFRASNTPAMLMKHVGEVPRPVLERRLDCPPALARAISIALAKKPEERWPDAAAFKAALDDERAEAPSVPHAPLPAAQSPRAPAPAPAWSPDANRDWREPWSLDANRDWREARREWSEARREWREHVDEQRDRWSAHHGGPLSRSKRFAELPIEERIRAFRRDAVSGAGTVAFLGFINLVFVPFFPWVIFPTIGVIRRLWRKFEYVESDGVSLRQALSPRWRTHLRNRQLLSPRAAAPAAAVTAGMMAGHVAQEVLDGPYGAVVRRAAVDRAAIVELMGRLPDADRTMIPDVAPTATALVERVVELATSLHRMEPDVADDALARLDARLATARQEAGDTREREHRVALLERQRASLGDLRSRRDLLLTQLESAALVLQNLRLDLLKLRSAGVDAAASGLNSATQEARALSRDIGHVLEAAAEVRKL